MGAWNTPYPRLDASSVDDFRHLGRGAYTGIIARPMDQSLALRLLQSLISESSEPVVLIAREAASYSCQVG